jgi:hypothetical protein
MQDPTIPQVVRAAIDGFGLPAAAIETAIVVGDRHGTVVAEARRQLPALRDLLVLEPDARVVGGYAHDAHLDAMAWLVERRAQVARTPWIVDPIAAHRHGARLGAVARAVEDLLWSASARFVDRMAGLGVLHAWLSGPAAPRFRAWADTAFAQGVFMPALRW